MGSLQTNEQSTCTEYYWIKPFRFVHISHRRGLWGLVSDERDQRLRLMEVQLEPSATTPSANNELVSNLCLSRQ